MPPERVLFLLGGVMMSNLEELLENKRKEMEDQALDREEIRNEWITKIDKAVIR